MISAIFTLIAICIAIVVALFAIFAIICELSTSERSYPLIWLALIGIIVMLVK